LFSRFNGHLHSSTNGENLGRLSLFFPTRHSRFSVFPCLEKSTQKTKTEKENIGKQKATN
jgi:hypothetical protein